MATALAVIWRVVIFSKVNVLQKGKCLVGLIFFCYYGEM